MNHYIDDNGFVYKGEMYLRTDNGRCYVYIEARPGSRIDKQGYAALRRISASVFNTYLAECKKAVAA